MAKARRRRTVRKRAKARAAGKPVPIVFTLSATQRAALKKKGLFRNNTTAIIRVRFASGRLTVLRHKKGNKFVPSNSAFA